MARHAAAVELSENSVELDVPARSDDVEKERDGESEPEWRSGRYDSKRATVAVGARIGIGQSMGGRVTVIMADRHRTYEAIGVLGYSGIHTVLPMPERDETVRAAEYFDYLRDTAPDELLIAQSAAHIGDFLYPFYYEDVPADILEADIGGGDPIRTTAPPTRHKMWDRVAHWYTTVKAERHTRAVL